VPRKQKPVASVVSEPPALKVRAINEVGTARFLVPQADWMLMPPKEQMLAWDELLLRAMRGAIRDHPDALYQFDFRELHPDAKDLVNPKANPEVIGEVHVLIYKPLS
jgi:hypothetical protein